MARAHHGSVSREQRAQIEEALKTRRAAGGGRDQLARARHRHGRGRPGGADRGARLGRVRAAAHRPRRPPGRRRQPRRRLSEVPRRPARERRRRRAHAAPARSRRCAIRATRSTCWRSRSSPWWRWTTGRSTTSRRCVRRAAPFAELPRAALEGVLDMLAGRYPSDAFAELRPRLTWDRVTRPPHAARRARGWSPSPRAARSPTAASTASSSSASGGPRVGELDEEMVYESRVGEVFVLGASSWRIEDITADRVLVSPAPGQPGKMPFWHGDAPGRPLELGPRPRRLRARARRRAQPTAQRERLAAAGLDARAAANLVALPRRAARRDRRPARRPHAGRRALPRRRSATGACACTPSSARACTRRGRRRSPPACASGSASTCRSIYGDDGIVLRMPEGDDACRRPRRSFLDADEVEDLVVAEVGDSALFASRFRECAGARAAAAAAPPRRSARRSGSSASARASLLQVASRYPSFPIVLETYRECLQDVFDLPALVELLARRAQPRRCGSSRSRPTLPSPFAASLQLAYVQRLHVRGRRAAGRAARPGAVARPRAPGRADGPRGAARAARRRRARGARSRSCSASPPNAQARRRRRRCTICCATLGDLERRRGRGARQRSGGAAGAGSRRWSARAARCACASPGRSAGSPSRTPPATATRSARRCRSACRRRFSSRSPDPLGDLVARYARTHGPFTAARSRRASASAPRWRERGAARARARAAASSRASSAPAAAGREWIDAEVLRRLRRRSLAALRREVEPAPPEALARLAARLARRRRRRRRGARGRRAAGASIEQLQGVAASRLGAGERRSCRARLPDYSPALLDQLGAAGELVWAGCRGARRATTAGSCWRCAEQAPLLLPEPLEAELSPLAQRLLDALAHARRALLPPARRRAVGRRRRRRAAAGAVGAGVGGTGDQRHLRAAARPAAARDRRDRERRCRAPEPAGALTRRRAARRRADAGALAPRRAATNRRGACTRRPSSCCGATASSRAAPCWRERIAAAASPACIRCCGPSRSRGRCRRGYFVEGLGGAQFALPGAVDRMRALGDAGERRAAASCSPPPIPRTRTAPRCRGPSARRCRWRPSRRAARPVPSSCWSTGALVLYVERGGRTLLSYCDDEEKLRVAVAALAEAARGGRLGQFELQRADGEAVRDTALGRALAQAGLPPHLPRGMQRTCLKATQSSWRRRACAPRWPGGELDRRPRPKALDFL